jgi:hypothetical protein
MELKCQEFLTWDNKPHASAKALDDLGLSVRFPRNTRCLPDRYRQQLLIPTPQPTPALSDDPYKFRRSPEIPQGKG